jgi:group I intron endonuclease
MAKKTNCGIYRLVNIDPSRETNELKCYVGSSINLKSRKNQHFSALENNKHCNSYLQRAYNKLNKKYGSMEINKYFKWELLEEIEKCNDKSVLKKLILSREQYYMDKFKSYSRKYGYNICSQAGNCLGKKASKETLEKLRISHLGIKITEETRQKHRNHRHSEETKKLLSKLNTKEKNAFFGREHSEDTKKRISETKTGTNKGDKNAFFGKKHSEESRNKMSESHNSKIKVINLDTREIFESITEASTAYNIKSLSKIGEVCNGKRKTTGGCRWKYYEEEKELT